MSAEPRRQLAVLTCMDARLEIWPWFGLERGDAHVIRNAGGLVTGDAIRSLAVSQRLLGTEQVAVVMHEQCGLHGGSDEAFADALRADGADPEWRLGAFADLEDALRAGLERLRSAPELPHRDRVRGFIAGPDSGELREIA